MVGNAETMATAMGIPGGVIDTVEFRGGTASVEPQDQVQVDALQTVEPPRYARPAPEGD